MDSTAQGRYEDRYRREDESVRSSIWLYAKPDDLLDAAHLGEQTLRAMCDYERQIRLIRLERSSHEQKHLERNQKRLRLVERLRTLVEAELETLIESTVLKNLEAENA